jgi:hypothetical protein
MIRKVWGLVAVFPAIIILVLQRIKGQYFGSPNRNVVEIIVYLAENYYANEIKVKNLSDF